MSASELERRRAHECRLTPDRALTTLDEAGEWLEERGLLTLMPCCSLPSLFAACHEEPYAPHGRGFAGWPKTKWWWAGAVERRPGTLFLRIHRGKGLLVPEETARLADPLPRAALADADEGRFGEEGRRLVEHLATAGPSLLDELKQELGFDAKTLRRAREPLERVGAIVARSVRIELDEGHTHSSELSRWDQRFPEPAAGGLEELLVAGVRAAVVAPERELRTWFSWPLERDAVDRLVDAGRLVRAGDRVTLASDSC